MRPSRLVLLLLCFVTLPILLTVFSLFHVHPRRHKLVTESSQPVRPSRFRALFSFHSPSSLFPPSAIISLTDDNSTFFLAKPAGFGPALPNDGLKGQLWVGSGFGDDSLRKGGAATGQAEGELGCSDVPGWSEGKQKYEHIGNGADSSKWVLQDASAALKVENDAKEQQTPHAGDFVGPEEHNYKKSNTPAQDDGTDDHLHHPLPESEVSKPSRPGQSAEYEATKEGSLPQHADIQSLQESAEIAGKIVLLSRGGCGFLEKVKWAQRRGGVAVIVGDNIRGGELVAMYARGDTSNVTIPSVFTSHTTAHLLSSLIPPGGSLVDNPSTEAEKGTQSDERHGIDKGKNNGGGKSNDGPTFTPTTDVPKSTLIPRPTIVPATRKRAIDDGVGPRKAGFFHALADVIGLGGGSRGLPADSRRPPSSGRLNWIISDTWSDGISEGRKDDRHGTSKNSAIDKTLRKAVTPQSPGDDFVIGVQDWRDPDLVGAQSPVKFSQGKIKSTSSIAAIKPTSSSKAMGQKLDEAFKGGSITPGSGEYELSGQDNIAEAPQSRQNPRPASLSDSDLKSSGDDGRNWLSQLIWSDTNEDMRGRTDQSLNTAESSGYYKAFEKAPNDEMNAGEEHWGLWVTITPTDMSTNPFFDTLLVLVVSPLVTLTVVYALLLLRSRIRRRRWRAPKAVVDRLPVRTYHTMSCTSSSTSIASLSNSRPATPLLQHSPSSVSSRPRPRSRTASEIGNTTPTSPTRAIRHAALSHKEKSNALRQWKKRYTGKQVECVVCLEEYVDGQSKVMSLPCGHEFHVECITPWLTTRRRTCPICKGDVVRSLANPAFTPSPPQPTFRDDTDQDLQARVAETTNESPSSAIPIPHSPEEADGDIERGGDMASTLVNDQPANSRGWRDIASMSLSAFTGVNGEAAWRQAQADRNR